MKSIWQQVFKTQWTAHVLAQSILHSLLALGCHINPGKLLHMDLSRSKWTLDRSLTSIVQPTNWIYFVLPVGSVVFAILATVRDGHLIADSGLLGFLFGLLLLLVCSFPYWSSPAETRSSGLDISHLKKSQISENHAFSNARWIELHEYSRNKTIFFLL